MNVYKLCFAIFLQFVVCFGLVAQIPNTLTHTEKEAGWRLLFDGKSLNGWRKLAGDGWAVKDGALTAISSAGSKQKDLLTTGEFDNFELFFEFKISKETNSGVKYLVSNDYPGQNGAFLGLEYQILDDVNFKYPERGVFRSLSSLYDLIPAHKKKITPLGYWNTARIIVDKNLVEHWLNGYKVVGYDRNSTELDTLVEKSKYKNLQNFGKSEKGYILLQNEGSPISFRNIKIRSIRN